MANQATCNLCDLSRLLPCTAMAFMVVVTFVQLFVAVVTCTLHAWCMQQTAGREQGVCCLIICLWSLPGSAYRHLAAVTWAGQCKWHLCMKHLHIYAVQQQQTVHSLLQQNDPIFCMLTTCPISVLTGEACVSATHQPDHYYVLLSHVPADDGQVGAWYRFCLPAAGAQVVLRCKSAELDPFRSCAHLVGGSWSH